MKNSSRWVSIWRIRAGRSRSSNRAPLVRLLSTLARENRGVAGGPVPLLLKVAPDLNPHQLADIVGVVGECGFAGIIATNTTITRPPGTEECATKGGLSGAPLLERSLRVVRFLVKAGGGRIPVVGCGGRGGPRLGQQAQRKPGRHGER